MKEETKTAEGPDRITRQRAEKWNQNDSHEKSRQGEDIRLPRPPFGAGEGGCQFQLGETWSLHCRLRCPDGGLHVGKTGPFPRENGGDRVALHCAISEPTTSVDSN